MYGRDIYRIRFDGDMVITMGMHLTIIEVHLLVGSSRES